MLSLSSSRVLPHVSLSSSNFSNRRPTISGRQHSPSIFNAFAQNYADYADDDEILDDGDYRTLRTTEERLDRGIKLFKMHVLDPLDEQGAEELSPEHIDTFMDAQRLRGLTIEECDKLKTRLIIVQVQEKKGIDTFKVMKLFVKTAISYTDLITDVMVLVVFTKTAPDLAMVQGASLAFSMLCQCVSSLTMGQPLWVGLAGLFGMKPVIEAWRDATNAKPFENQKVNNEMMLFISRIVEIVTEAIPQALIQCVALFLYPKERSTLQFFSLFASFLTTGATVAFSDREIDTSKHRRKTDPLLYGYVPDTNQNKQALVSVVFFTSYKTAKMFALSMLIASSSALYAVGLLALEYFGFLSWRMWFGNWRLYRNGVDGTVFSLLVHLCWYLSLLSAPFPVLRNPTAFTPRIYSIGLLYNIAINFAIIAISYHVFGATEYLDESYVWLGLSLVTAVCLVSGAISYHYVPKSHKTTFYQHLTIKEHVATFWWNYQTSTTDHQHREVDTQEAVRALIAVKYSLHYLPKEKLIELYKNRWTDWCTDPPQWFDEDFRALVPRELLAGVPEHLWEGEATDTEEQ